MRIKINKKMRNCGVFFLCLFLMHTVSAIDLGNVLYKMDLVMLVSAFFVAIIIALIPFRGMKSNDVRTSSTQKKISVGIAVVAAMLVVTVIITGFQYQKSLENLLISQFNRQQLILARQAASCVEGFVLRLSTDIEATSKEGIVNENCLIGLYRRHRGDVENIFLLNSTGHLTSIYPEDMPNITGKDFSFRKYFRECRKTGKPYVSEILFAGGEKYADVGNRHRSFVVAAPIPNSSNGFDGILGVTVSIPAVNERFIYPIVSGDTGYGWMIDDEGYFVAHSNREFEGECAFLIRQRIAPGISFQEINDIMRDEMMKGEEGVDSYTSGWHCNKTGEIKKLIAYAPIAMGDKTWSVAVVAPVEDVVGTAKMFHTHQLYLTLLSISVIFIATVGMAGMSLRYNKLLENDVRKRTSEIELMNKELGESYRKLKESDRLKDDFMNIAAHELKTPLVPIKGYLGVLCEGLPKDVGGDVKKSLKVISRNVVRLENLINDILDVSKLESGVMKFDRETVDIAGVIKDSVQDMKSLAEQKGLIIEAEIKTKLPPVKGDRAKFTQVITNLLNNAIKFTEKGEITVSVERSNDEVIVSVKDTGIGIAKRNIGKLFTKFYQIDSGLDRRHGGSGLGLVICKRIVEHHDGRIWVESKAGEGSTFYFTLPLAGDS